MKSVNKYIAVLLAIFLVFGGLPLGSLTGSGGIFELRANAYYSEGIYNYGVITSPTQYAYITGLNQYVAGAVVVPSSLGGYPVYEVPGSLFYNKIDITSVTVQAGINKIGDEAFRGCKALISVSLPTGLLTIGNNEFYDCTALGSIVIPDSVTSLGYGTFYNCTHLTTAVLSDGLVALSNSAFLKCTLLTNVDLPANLNSIGYSAFQECSSLKNISIPASVKSIGESGFTDCTSLESIVLPNGLTALGAWQFYGCTSLKSASLPDTLTTVYELTFKGCSSLTSVTLPAGLTEIPDSMFDGCNKLASISIPDTVKYIDASAFSGCFALTSFDWPSQLTFIGTNAFWGSGLTGNLVLLAGITAIGMNAFKQCNKLTVVSIPNSVTSLLPGTFQYCSSLVSVSISNSVVNFGTDVFSDCPNLTIYCIPGSVAKTYAEAKGIPYIYISLYTVAFNANGGTGGTSGAHYCGTALTAPTVTRTGYSFAGWSPAVPLAAPAANTTYTAQWTVNKYKIAFESLHSSGWSFYNYGSPLTAPEVAFYPYDLLVFTGWSPLVPATVPAQDSTYTAQYTPVYTYTVSSGVATITAVSTLVTGALEIPSVLGGYPVTSIGYHAFQNCTGITSIIIPPSVTFIDTRAFMGCTGLTAVTIPAGVTSIGSQAFQDCTALASITVPDSLVSIGTAAFLNTAWFDGKPNGLVYAGKFVYKYKGTMPALAGIALSAGTLGIADYAFSACSNLTYITIPESLTFIGIRSFIGCTGLAALIVPENVVSIGSQAFANCTVLTLGCFAESYGHTYANTNDIPHALVAKITYDANGGNGGGSFVMYCGTAMTAPTVTRSSFVFSGWSPVVPALVPEVNTTYTAQWVTLLSYTITNQVVTITGLNTALNGRLTIPDTIEGFPVKYIAASALKNKTGLTGVDFPAGLLTIGEQAFRGCTGLTSLTLPSSLTTIEAAAFYGCTNLTSITIPASVRTIGTEVFTGCTGLTVYVYPRSYALDYADGNHLNYKVFVTVTFSLNGGSGTVPSAQNGVTGNIASLPAQGDILRANYHFLGWAATASATAPLASYTMAKANVTLYAVWSMIPSVSARSGSDTVIDTQSSFIYGLAPGITQAAFESVYVALAGNGRLEYTLPGSGSFGTGTQVQVIDNVTGLPVKTYTIIIFGDINGDGNIDGNDAGTAVEVENFNVVWDPIVDAAKIKAGDINKDGNVDSNDAGLMVEVENYNLSVDQVTGLAS